MQDYGHRLMTLRFRRKERRRGAEGGEEGGKGVLEVSSQVVWVMSLVYELIIGWDASG